METTEAWVLHEGPAPSAERRSNEAPVPADLRLESFSLGEMKDDEALVEPVFGCWEANMSHAVARSPIDICRARREPRVVLGNSGTVRVLRVGRDVKDVREGEVYSFFGSGVVDRHGYMVKAWAYDAPNTVGLLAKRTIVPAKNLLELPARSRYSVQQWTAFTLRYLTAWSNWRVAHGCYRLQVPATADPKPVACGWGGGTTLAELDLARRFGWQASMVSGSESHLRTIASLGIVALNRRELGILDFDDRRFATEPEYRAAFERGERRFLAKIHELTRGNGVAIFVDYLGSPLWRLTTRALGREGVVATAGWKFGMNLPLNRAVACIQRHTYVNTHYARLDEGVEAIAFAEEHGWIPESDLPVYAWNDVPKLVADFASNSIRSYFPLFAVNAG
jgi:NADPH:quinone reductase-like Zn-dependent oxidoreductase